MYPKNIPLRKQVIKDVLKLVREGVQSTQKNKIITRKDIVKGAWSLSFNEWKSVHDTIGHEDHILVFMWFKNKENNIDENCLKWNIIE